MKELKYFFNWGNSFWLYLFWGCSLEFLSIIIILFIWGAVFDLEIPFWLFFDIELILPFWFWFLIFIFFTFFLYFYVTLVFMLPFNVKMLKFLFTDINIVVVVVKMVIRGTILSIFREMCSLKNSFFLSLERCSLKK